MNILLKITKKIKFLLFLALFLTLYGCFSKSPRLPERYSNIDLGIESATIHLLEQISVEENAIFTIDFNTNFGKTKESERIEKRIKALIQQKRQFKFVELMEFEKLKKIRSTDMFIIVGLIERTSNTVGHSVFYPHLNISIVDESLQETIADSEILITDEALAFEPIPFNEKNPIPPQNPMMDAEKIAAQSSVGTNIEGYLKTLSTKALLDEASKFWENHNFEKAIELFKQAEQQSDGKIGDTYYGLYLCYFNLNMKELAEDAIENQIKYELQDGDITMKFLFTSGTSDFIKDNEDDYVIWIKKISENMVRSPFNFNLIGHASKYGNLNKNKILANHRAEEMKKYLIKANSNVKNKIIKIEGVGSSQCISCTGQEEMDSTDRRVEIKKVN
jgi:outer membrane protein OmpA-like peptidoglycan-associated protein